MGAFNLTIPNKKCDDGLVPQLQMLTSDVNDALNQIHSNQVKSSGGAYLSPLTTLGDTLYGAAAGDAARLAGNASATRKFLRQTGTGSVSAAPAWDTLVSGDIPALTITLSGDVSGSGTTAITTAIGALKVLNSMIANGTIDLTAKVTGILPSPNGGTGVSNAGTITNASNTTITGGGMLGLGGFSFTIPATGTAAMLNQPNSFTLINPLTTIAESWIGPSSTAGVYFKSGNVGIGTATPRKLADFLSVSQAQLRLTYTDNSVYTDFQTNSSGNLSVSPTGGNVGIGTATPRKLADFLSVSQAQLRLTYTDNSVYTDFQTNSSGNLIVTPTGPLFSLANTVRLQSSDYASQTTGWGITGGGAADFRYVYADELHAKSFIADLEQALAGGQVISKSVAPLAADFTVPAAGGIATLVVESFKGFDSFKVYVDSDFVNIREFARTGTSLSISNCWGTVAWVSTDTTAKTQTYTFTRSSAPNAGAATATDVIGRGALALDYGTTGNGYIEANAIDGAMAANSPYTQIVTWATHPNSGKTVRTRTGNLNGITGVVEYGLYAGDGAVAATNKFVRITDQNFEIHNIGLDIFEGSTKTISLNQSAPYLALGNPMPTSYLQASTTGIWMGNAGSSVYKMRVGAVDSGSALTAGWSWDGSNLSIIGSITITNSIPSGSISGLGALATKSSVDLSTAEVTNKSLANVDSTANTKLGGIATGATVGATWGTNLFSIPATLGAPAGSGLFLSSTNMGYYTASAWKTYIDSSGNMILGDIVGGNTGLSWNQGTGVLTIKGVINITSGSVPNASVTGLGALALKASVDLSTAEVTNKSLANVDSAASTKLGGIATGATVGATWGTNLFSIPATLGAPAGSGLFLSSTNMGYYSASAWKTYIDSSGNMILGDIVGGNTGLSWNQGTGVLTIKGSITITAGSVPNTVVTGLGTLSTINAGSGALSSVDSTANTKLGGIEAGANVTSTHTAADVTNVNGVLAATVQGYAERAHLGLSSTGGITLPVVAAPTGSGLFLGSDKLGFYTSSAWKTYMDNAGNFYLGGTSGALQWNGTTLSIVNGVMTMSGASSYIAIGLAGTLPTETSPGTGFGGTGLISDRTGMYGLLSGTVQAKFDAVTGAITAGAGKVVLDANGITIPVVTDSGVTSIKWTNSQIDSASIQAFPNGSFDNWMEYILRSTGVSVNSTMSFRATSSSMSSYARMDICNVAATQQSYIWMGGTSFTGLAVGTGAAEAMIDLGVQDSGINTIVDLAILRHSYNASIFDIATGFGSAMLFKLQGSGVTNFRDAARIGALWTTATDASRTSAVVIQTVNNAGALAEVARFAGSGVTFTGQYFSAKYGAGNTGTALTLDWNNGNVQTCTATGNVTFTLNNPKSGSRYLIIITQDGTGGRTYTWPGTVKWSGGTAPAGSALNKTDVIAMVWDGTSYFASALLNF